MGTWFTRFTGSLQLALMSDCARSDDVDDSRLAELKFWVSCVVYWGDWGAVVVDMAWHGMTCVARSRLPYLVFQSPRGNRDIA